MANWGALEGLGQGLTEIGRIWGQNEKSKLAEQLEQQREERAEQRSIAKEERQRKRDESTAADFRIERDADGVTWRQGYNKFGQRTGDRELASAEDIKNYNFEDQKNKVTLENLVSKGSREAEKHAADLTYKGALTDAAIARAEASRNPRPRSGGRGSLDSSDSTPLNDTEVAAALLKEYPDLIKQYAQNKDNPLGLTASELHNLALATIKEARQQGKDPLDTFRIGLPRYAALRASRKKPTTNSGGKLNLGN